MSLAEALTLFRRLGVHIETMSRRDFRSSYFALAKRYHPDRNPPQCRIDGQHQCREGGDLALLPAISVLTVN